MSHCQVKNGRFFNVFYMRNLPADDCFVMAAQFFSTGDYYHCLPWLLTTEKLINNPATVSDLHRSFNRTILYDYLAYSSYAQGNFEHAVYYSRLLNSIGLLFCSEEFVLNEHCRSHLSHC